MNNKATEAEAERVNLQRGDDAWIGRAVLKKFDSFGWFRGRVTETDENISKPGYRVFHVEYEDGDDEWMGAEELIGIMSVCL